ncbi:MAG: DUF4417 domain-containing protein [Bacteroidales bacterium]|nr:DUF4417 domain-containing protein [Bacteroidales bacterium]
MGDGIWDIPHINPCTSIDTTEFIPFNTAKTDKEPGKKGIHTFVDDYQIDRVWNYPERYIEMFKRFNCVMSPDYSMYVNFPLAMQLWNHYRKMWVTAYMQEYGVNMIPVACWSDSRSYDFCFNGMPKESIIAVSNVGCIKGAAQQYYFKQGFEVMLRVLQPIQILFYGQPPEWMKMYDITLIGNSHQRFESYTVERGEE